MAKFRVPLATLFIALVGAIACTASAQGPALVVGPAASTTNAAPPACTPAVASSVMVLSPTQESGSEGIVRLSANAFSDLDAAPSVSDVPPIRPAGLDPFVSSENGPAPMGPPPVQPGAAGPAPVEPHSGFECASGDGQWILGADFLYVRSHFSQATAFAAGSQTASSYHISAEPLDLQYTPAFRVFAGYRFDGSDTEMRFTYTRITADTQSDAGNFSAGHFAVDPFGNVVGTVVVVNPSSAEFGHAIVGGDHIQAAADLTVSVYDLDLIKPLMCVCGGWQVKYTMGVRVAQVDQSYESTILKSGVFFSGGEYTSDFTGAGPRIGLQAEKLFGSCRQFSVFANTAGSLLVGDYNSHFSQTTTAPAFQASQDTDIIRLLPVAEAEIGAGWSPLPCCNLSAGWMFQAWFDLGASGGTFGGFYTVTENSNLLAFEGLFARVELSF